MAAECGWKAFRVSKHSEILEPNYNKTEIGEVTCVLDAKQFPGLIGCIKTGQEFSIRMLPTISGELKSWQQILQNDVHAPRNFLWSQIESSFHTTIYSTKTSDLFSTNVDYIHLGYLHQSLPSFLKFWPTHQWVTRLLILSIKILLTMLM